VEDEDVEEDCGERKSAWSLPNRRGEDMVVRV